MDKRGLGSLRRFIRIVTEGGTSKEIDALWDTILDDHKKHDDCGFFGENHLKQRLTINNRIMIYKRNMVWVDHDGGRCFLDVERIIAINPQKKRIYFDSTFWDLDEHDFMAVYESWTGVDIKDECD